MAGDENVSFVPGWTAPVFVIVSGWFAAQLHQQSIRGGVICSTNPGHQDHNPK